MRLLSSVEGGEKEKKMFDHNHYVPILKWRMGEYQALLNLKKGVADWVTPLLEIPTEGWDFEKEEPAKSIDDHLSSFVSDRRIPFLRAVELAGSI